MTIIVESLCLTRFRNLITIRRGRLIPVSRKRIHVNQTQPTRTTNEWIEFRPRSSSGRWWTGGLGLGILIMFILPFIASWEEIPLFVVIPFVILGIGVSAPLLAVAWYFPDMRYWVGKEELVLTYGPMMNDRIPLETIRSIHKQNLRLSPISSFRFPGLAVFDVHYLGTGSMRMCASSASKDILLIDTGKRRYGITPQDETGLLRAILERSSDNIQLPEGFGSDQEPETTISR